MKLIWMLLPYLIACNSSTFRGEGSGSKQGNKVEQPSSSSKQADGSAVPATTAVAVGTPETKTAVALDTPAPKVSAIDPSKNDSSSPQNHVGGESLANSSTKKPALDIIWVVDNSASMQNTSTTLGKQIQTFLTTISAVRDVQIAVLGRKGNMRTEVETSDDKRILSINQWVASTNSLAIATAALCREDETSLVTPAIFGPVNPNDAMICGVNVLTTSLSGKKVLEIEDRNNVLEARGILRQWIRSDATHAFVFVTDDNSAGVDENVFLKIVGTRFTDKPKVFAFVGLEGKSTCNPFSMGKVYEKLAAATGGEAFDYCASDWTPAYNKMLSKLQ